MKNELLNVVIAMGEYIDALPSDVVASLPTMPGFDRDWAVQVIDAAKHAEKALSSNVSVPIPIEVLAEELVAENWSMREILRELLKKRPGGVYFNKWETAILKVLNEVPKTTAVLAAIQLTGVREFTSEMLTRADDESNSLSDDVRKGMREAEMYARTFIDLREGKESVSSNFRHCGSKSKDYEHLDSMLTESVQALKAAAQRNAELELRLAVEIEPPPVIYPGRYDCHFMHSAIRRAGFRVSGDSEHVGDVDMRDERALAAVSDKQRIAELEARLATPVQLLDARTERDYEQTEKWNGPDPYCMGHLDGWNANRLEQSALLKKQGFRVEGDE